MYCTRCGTKAKEGDYYCRKCGAVVDYDGLEAVTSFPPIPRTERNLSSSSSVLEGDEDLNWTSILGFILGLVSVFLCWTVAISFFSGVLGLIFSMIGRKSQKKKMAKAGVILNIIGSLVSIIIGLYYVYLIQSVFNSSIPYYLEFERQMQNIF
ncbi:MAG: hypothetical protein IJ091_06715 [Oscillospiraceae bacterium]|nr:hypothetical protein [Oscillospiraceae bacterium]